MSSVAKGAQKVALKKSEKAAKTQLTRTAVKIEVLEKPSELKRVVQALVRENKNAFSGILTTSETVKKPKPKVDSTQPTKAQIRRVVERNIHSVYDHPKIIEAVAEYLHKHFVK